MTQTMHNQTTDRRAATVSAPRTVRTWKMFTTEGRPVFELGYKKYGLNATANVSMRNRQAQAQAHAFDSERNKSSRLKHAEDCLGVPVEWREVEPSETMPVSI